MTMSEPVLPTGEAPKKKGSKMKSLLIYGVGIFVLVGGGVGGGIYASGSGMIGGGKLEPNVDKNKPQLVLKAEGGEMASVGDSGGEHGAEQAVTGETKATPTGGGTGKYQATYYPIEQSFTSNLADTDGLAQVALAVSTYYDSRVIDNLKRHEMAVRSAILMTLANQEAAVISTPNGKQLLQKELKNTINGVLQQKEGFGGIDGVYFTSFIIQ
jgi:flagellar protein FliL